METVMTLFTLAIVVILVILFVNKASNESKEREKNWEAEYDALSEDVKKKITREEYIRRKNARATYNSTNENVLEDVGTPAIIKCPACGGNVSNKAKTCPHCGQPIDVKIYCPNCGSTNIELISGTDKAVTTWAVGVYAANTVINKCRCKDCGHKF